MDTKRLLEKENSFRTETKLIENLKLKQSNFSRENCLKKHSITSCMRAKMIDWLLEVAVAYDCQPSVVFLSITYMDRFFKNFYTKLKAKKLHMTGMVALFLASKYQSVFPLPIKALVEKIAHNKYLPVEFLNFERVFLKVLNFKLNTPTVFTFLDIFSTQFLVPKCVHQTALVVSLISEFFYENLDLLPSSVATAALIIAATSTNQFALATLIVSSVKVPPSNEVIEKVRSKVYSFPQNYPNLKHLEQAYEVSFALKKPGPLFRFVNKSLRTEQNHLLKNPF